ncbi:MAG TPA: AraC family transcriptional regulator [Dinghuibacter sp.]|jgi:AraC-like DNA-binding protein|uniref:AraC family transcriptional regulator n=1 Tax=Dinghuibacter sp. TaxID=2024697 RepID=UPI002C1E6878|nr:AraC family transcriptional regulator [Dinghuibacter sp.]HTJ15082.1 AraC family transcriptional regulator [Dinghuibacter sp.]
MPARPDPFPLSDRLDTLVENRRVFNLDHCELNIYESYQQAYRVPLTFHDFVVTSMLRGRKVMHIFGDPAFDYLPGESVIAPAGETMVIDFPDAEANRPTQCIALTVDAAYVRDTVHYLDGYYRGEKGEDTEWSLRFNQYHFDNEAEVSGLINKLVRVCSCGDKAKNIYADLNLKELLIRLIQSQHLYQISSEAGRHENQSRLHFVLHYIHEHLTERIPVDTLSRKAYLSRNMFFKWFKEQFGLTPLDYVNRERIRLAKELLATSPGSISDISARCGFTDVNYFVRVFRKSEGVTPGAYRRAGTPRAY